MGKKKQKKEKLKKPKVKWKTITLAEYNEKLINSLCQQKAK